MAIYVDNIGDTNLPVTLNNPQPGEGLVWDPTAGAFVNAPQSASAEVIQDTVAEMLEVDPAGSNLSLRLVSNYDDVTGKLTFNVVTDAGTGGGGSSNLIIKENGATRGVATTLDFAGASIGLDNGVATITGLLDKIKISDTGANFGDVTKFDFHGFDLTIIEDTLRVVAPDLTTLATRTYVDNAIANIGDSYTLPTASASALGGVKVGSGLAIDSQGVLTATGTNVVSLPWSSITDKPALFSGNYTDLSGKPTIPSDVSQLTDTQGLLGSGSGSYTLPTATTSVLGGVKVDGSTITISNGVISAVGGGSGSGVTLSDVGTYLNNNGYATQTYVQGQIDNLVNGAPGTLNTLQELAAAIASNPNFATDLTSTLSGKLNVSGGTMTGALTLSGAPTVDLHAATKKYVDDKFTVNASASVSPSFAETVANQVSLGQLSNVNLSSISAGQILGFNGTEFVPVNNSGTKGDTGATGPQGPAGLSIASAAVSLQGKLLITLSNNNVVDAGSVAGISSATVNGSGDLVLTKQDGTTINAGSVIGPQGQQGATGATGTTGATGATGATGVGFSSATVDGSGRLIITKTDSTTVDAGSVIGPQGAQGTTGNTGATGAKGDRGISVVQAIIDSGNLLLTLDDASQINAGTVTGDQGPQGVQGPAGRSIADSGVVVDASGYLQVTLSDGTTINAGYVVGPQGSTGSTGAKGDKGDTGEVGPTGATGATGTSYTINNKSGTVQVYGIGNTTQPGYDLEVDLANKANKWTTARTLTLSGKVTGLTSFDGSGNITMTTALNATTSDVSEGNRLYYTDARARLALSSISDSNITSLISYDDATGQIKYRANTSYVTEGSNLYFTNTRADARADARIAASSINALADVDTVTSAPTNGQVLTWTGSAWTPSSVAGGSGAISSVNAKTGIVVLNTDDVSEGTTNLYYTTSRWDNRLAAKTTDNLNEGTSNKYFSNTLARNALSAGTGLSYNSSTGTFSLNANSDNVSEGTTNLYYTSTRFDTRLGQSNLRQLADVADTTPTTGQALAWNGSSWAPTTISSGGGGGGGGTSSGIFRAAVQVEYDASGNLSSVSVLDGGISAVIATATSTTATVTFTFTGSSCAPLNIQVYGYQRASNVFVTRGIGSDYSARTLAGGGSAGAPSAFSAFDPSANTMTLSLTKALTGATAAVGQTTHCVVQFLLNA